MLMCLHSSSPRRSTYSSTPRNLLNGKWIIAALSLPLALAASAPAPTQETPPAISITFLIDGEPAPCEKPQVELKVNHASVTVEQTDDGFLIPEAISKLNASQRGDRRNVDIKIVCGKFTFDFPDEYPSRVRPGQWEVGIAYPDQWFEQFRRSRVLDRATWVSYVIWRCGDCEPVTVTEVAQKDPPPDVLERLRQEQPNARGERAMHLAYAMAVFNVEHDRNRDYLLGLFENCLSRPANSPLDEVCDGTTLFDSLANLYWRGDAGLLDPLLKSATSHASVAQESGEFYAALLDRHTAEVLHKLKSLPSEIQQAVCKSAGANEAAATPRFQRITDHLNAAHGGAAKQCLQTAMAAIH